MRVLVTRPLPDGERTAATLRGRGYDVLVAPLMQVKPIAADLAGEWSAVIISSANALRAIDAPQIASLTKLPLFAVGQRSADAAREVGFRDVRSANGDARDLIRLVASQADTSATSLYLAGEDRAADLESELGKGGVRVRTVTVYKNVTLGYPPELVDALRNRKIDAVLHFSRRSAENYMNGAKASGLEQLAQAPQHFCLSAQVAEPLRTAGVVDQITVAPEPNEAALLALLPPPSA
jgi:uroporphyrinogen-III synthase